MAVLLPPSVVHSTAASPCSDRALQALELPDKSPYMLAGTEPFRYSDLKQVTKITNFRLCTTKLNNLLMIKRSSNTQADFQLKITSFTFVAGNERAIKTALSVRENEDCEFLLFDNA